MIHMCSCHACYKIYRHLPQYCCKNIVLVKFVTYTYYCHEHVFSKCDHTPHVLLLFTLKLNKFEISSTNIMFMTGTPHEKNRNIRSQLICMQVSSDSLFFNLKYIN